MKKQCAHYKGDLYSEIARLEKRNEWLLTALIAVLFFSSSIITCLAWWGKVYQ